MIEKIQKRLWSIRKRVEKRKKVRQLKQNNKKYDLSTIPVWKLPENSDRSALLVNKLDFYTIFDERVDLNNVNWHKDYVSGFEYPVKRFDKIKISRWYDKGIDIKFPWEVSRFYFAVPFAQNYTATVDERYYIRFRDLVQDWIKKNPFLYGVNWHCTMEVSIRAVNWIVAMNLFGERFERDEEFYRSLVTSLQQHAGYIDAFPEIKPDGTANNHLIADYFGLLFLAVTLRDHPEADKWLLTSTEGLEQCIQTQVNDDGTSFEGSIPYHRLVLEMFGYAAILCRTNNIELSASYYERIFTMFEFTAAYMDQNGNAPQIGDNDSGRTIIFHQSDEHDHSYLLDLGEHLFNYRFLSQCEKRNNEYVFWLPEIEKINVNIEG